MDAQTEHHDHTFTDEDFSAQTLSKIRFTDCTFVNCNFENTRMLDCQFVECRFQKCNVVATRFANSSLNQVRFEGGRAMGVDWSVVRGLTLDLGFDSVKLDYSSFVDLNLRRTVFKDCSMLEVVFDGCDLRNTRFAGSRLTGARVRQCDVRGADFRKTEGCAIDHESCTVKATLVDMDTAALVLKRLGLGCPDLEAVLGW